MASNASLHPQTPDVPFQEGDILTPVTAYMMAQGPFFDDLPQYLCHRERLKDDELSNSPTAIKARVAALESGLRFSVQSGRVVQWNAGTVLLSTGELVAVAAGTLTVPANTTTFLWYQEGVGVTSGPLPPNLKALLARAVAGATTISVLEDLRNPASIRVLPNANTIRVLGGQATTDKTCIQGEAFGLGVYYFRDFIVPAGVTVTFTTNTTIYCSGRFQVAGSIVLAANIPGAPVTPAVMTNLGNTASMPGQGLGGSGSAYGFGAQAYGSGGSTGSGLATNASGWGVVAKAGNGAVGLIVEAAGTIEVLSTGSIIAQGQQADSAVTANTGNASLVLVSGSGGGSGGLISLSSRLSIAVQGTLNVQGGAGGAAYRASGVAASQVALGGNPGSGGAIVLQAPSVNTTNGAFLVSAGSHGTSVGLNGSNQVTNPTAILGGGAGGGFGGNTGSAVSSGSGTITVTFNPGGVGVLHIFNTIPVG